jgi:hypothetical protein
MKTVMSTLAIVTIVGLIAQYGESSGASSAPVFAAPGTATSKSLMLSTNAQGSAVFGLPQPPVVARSQAIPQPVVPVNVAYKEIQPPKLGTILATPVEGCAVTLTGTTNPEAMVHLVVTAPCNKSAPFVVRHDALELSAVTDSEGNAALDMPAFFETAHFAVLFNNVEMANAAVSVPQVSDFNRIVLQWRGDDNLQLHALDEGASFGDRGHVWSASEHKHGGSLGFVLRLGDRFGDASSLAEVYTYPAIPVEGATPVHLKAGIVVTELNCGRDFDAVLIRARGGRLVAREPIVLKTASCSSAAMGMVLRDQLGEIVLAGR